ncbi:MAG: hypothetical protein ACP5C3_06310 [Methanomicrobiales archaeon]
MEKSIKKFEDELSKLESKKVIHDDKVINTAEKIIELKENLLSNDDPEMKKLLKTLEKDVDDLKNIDKDFVKEIDLKKEEINSITKQKDEIIKKSLIKLHEDMKREYKQTDLDRAKYMELYRSKKDKMSVLDKKIMYLKLLISKNYDLRLL